MADHNTLKTTIEVLTEIKAAIRTISNRLGALERKCATPSEASDWTSGRRVMDVPELFERILLLLPMREILLAQRVSKQFKAFIATSKPLQRALFMEGEPQKEGAESIEPRLNPLLTDYTRYRLIPITVEPFSIWPEVLAWPVNAEQQPLAPKRCLVLRNPDTDEWNVVIELRTMDPNFWDPKLNSMTAKYCSGSWLRMYWSQPPCEVYATAGECNVEKADGRAVPFGEMFNGPHQDFDEEPAPEPFFNGLEWNLDGGTEED